MKVQLVKQRIKKKQETQSGAAPLLGERTPEGGHWFNLWGLLFAASRSPEEEARLERQRDFIRADIDAVKANIGELETALVLADATTKKKLDSELREARRLLKLVENDLKNVV